MTVTFCGQREIDEGETETVLEWLRETVERLIGRGANTFYFGAYEGFDRLAASVVWDKKKKYPRILSVLVPAYQGRKVDSTEYDYTTYPPLEKVPRRFAVIKRDEWLVEMSDAVVTYTPSGSSESGAMMEYAKRKGKEIVVYSAQ